MNIWIFNHYGNGPGTSGGTRHFDLAKELVKNGYSVTIFASSFAHQSTEDTCITDPAVKVKEESFDGVKFVWIKTTAYDRNDWRRVKNIFDYTFRAYHFAKKLNEQPTIIIGSLMHPLAPIIAYRLAKKKKAAFLFEERDLWPQTLIDIGKVSKYHPIVLFLSILEKFLYIKSDKIIVLFDKATNYVVSRGIKREKVVYLPNGVDLQRFDSRSSTLPDEVEASLEPLKEKFVAIYTGSHAVSDYLEALLLTANVVKYQNQHIHFLFVGNGPKKKQLIEMKEQLKLTNVTFLPPIPKEYIPSLLNRANVGLISLGDSDIYKWGISFNKLYDYMAATLPTVLLSKQSESHIENSNGGMLVSSVEEMASALIELSSNEEKRLTLGNNARNYVEKYHTWDALANKLIHSFNDEVVIKEKANLQKLEDFK